MSVMPCRYHSVGWQRGGRAGRARRSGVDLSVLPSAGGRPDFSKDESQLGDDLSQHFEPLDREDMSMLSDCPHRGERFAVLDLGLRIKIAP